jgi:excisionase family DNA binding protein
MVDTGIRGPAVLLLEGFTHMPDDLLSLQAASFRYGVSVKTIRRRISAGDLAAYRLGGRLIRVSKSEVDALFHLIPAGIAA